jgi:hypothetical protein
MAKSDQGDLAVGYGHDGGWQPKFVFDQEFLRRSGTTGVRGSTTADGDLSGSTA